MFTKGIHDINTMLKFSFLIVITFSINACSDDEFLMENEESNTIEIGDYFLLQENIDRLPYLNKKEIVFIDSNYKKTVFKILENDVFLTVSGTLYKYNIVEEGDTVKYHYRSQIKSFIIKNDSLNMHLSLRLSASPYHIDPESRYVADVLNIFCTDPEESFRSGQVFYHVTDARSWPTYSKNEPIDQIEFINRKFYNVLKNDFTNPLSNIYFNYEYGIVSLTDFSGNLWRFEALN
jgi:hypothetical protein